MNTIGKQSGDRDAQLLAELDELASNGLLRRPRIIQPLPAGKAIVDGVERISFGSNDYLGLSQDPRVNEAAKKSLSLGAGTTGSRLTSGNLPIYQELEPALAEFKHSDAAVVFSSGYAANVGTIPALVGHSDLILSDSLNHASLIDGCRLSRAEVRIYNHKDANHARHLLADRSDFRRALIITDGVFSMDGDLAPLPELVELCDRFGGWMMVDDAHGTGVYGEQGSGVAEHFGVIDRIDIQMGTLSKALGSAGAFVAGSKPLIDLLRNKARSFMFSTANVPAAAAAAVEALRLARTEPQLRSRLKANITQMRQGLASKGIQILDGDSPIIPVNVGNPSAAMQVSSALEEKGLWVPAIRPPTVPAGCSRLRLTVTAAHSYSQIALAIDAITEIMTKFNLRIRAA